MAEAAAAPWPAVVACLVILPEAVSLTSALLQRSRIGRPLPPELLGIYEQEDYAASARYARAKSDMGLLKGSFEQVVFFAFWFLRGFPWLDGLCVALGLESQVLTGVVFVAALGLGHMLLDIPWGVYGTFVLEEKFGFNKTTPWTFVKDLLKSTLLSALLGGPLMALALWFLVAAGPQGWLWVFLTTVAVQLAAAFLAPALILPLFMEMIPLPRGTAWITGEPEAGEASPGFLASRQFYAREGDYNGRPCWETRDRRFAGAKAGAQLSIWWSAGGDGTDGRGHGLQGPRWLLAEGSPGCGGPVYAVCTSPALDEGLPGASAEWLLTAEAKASAERREGEGAAAGLRGPLAQEHAEPPGMLRTTSVDVGSLHSKIQALAERLGYRGASVFVIDGSSRSGHSNAFCTGFGSMRRICLFDTLLPLMSEGEILAVLGHEIGHDRLYHVHTRLVIGFLQYFLMLFALGRFLASRAISSAFFVPEPKVYVGVVLFSIVWSVVEFAFAIPSTVQSRMHEFAADRYSIDADESFGPLLASALKKLIRKSKVNLTPHPVTVFLTYSHPPLDARLKAIREHHALRYGSGAGGSRELSLQCTRL